MKAKDLRQLFVTEAHHGLEILKALWVQAGRNPDDETLWHRLLRQLESQAADARSAGAADLALLLTAVSQIPSGLLEGRYDFGPLYLKLLGVLLEHAEAQVGAFADDQPSPVGWGPLVDLCNRAYNRESFSLKGFSLAEMLRQKKGADQSAALSTQAEESVQISLKAVERLGNRLNSVIVHQFQLKKNSDGLQLLETQVRDLVQGLKSGEATGPLLRGAETVLKDLQTLTTSLKEDLVTVDRSSFGLQEEIARLRMLPFQVIAGQLETGVRAQAAEAGIAVALVVEGLETLVDKTILELVLSPLAELLGNAVRHGVSARHGVANEQNGTLRLSCGSDGTTIRIAVADTGPGIDFEALRQAALLVFPLETDEIKGMGPPQLTRFLFEPGIQGKAGLSGVKDALDAMQGKITVTSTPESGTEVVLQIPASVSMVSGFFILAGGEKFFISAVYVREIVIFNRRELVSLPGGPAYPLRQEVVPVVPLSSVFHGKETLRKDVEQMAVISLLGETWGIILDGIVRHATLSYKPLPDNLASLKEVQGLVYDEKFRLVPILNIPAIISQIRRLRSIEFRRRYQRNDISGRNILLVDDSLVARQTLGRVLSEGGYTVEVAEDGIQALELLHTKYFHLVVTDDEMPRMDGMTLLENLRKEPEYVNVPVVVLISERDGALEARFRAAGIRDFFRKSDFDRQSLLRDLHRLLAGN